MASATTKQSLWLSLTSLVIVGPHLVKVGTNIVTHTYALSSQRLWSGVSLYLPPAPGADWHKYSPFFALLYSPFAWLPPVPQALLWMSLNAWVYWYGISRWCRIEKKSSWWIWLMLVAASMELDGSLRYQQVNALLIGLVLIALADFREVSKSRGGALLALGTNLKLLPGVFLLPLMVPWRKSYVRGVAAATIFALLAPALVVGLVKDVQLHRDWVRLLWSDATGQGLLDIQSVLQRLGWSRPLALSVRGSIGVISLGLLLLSRRLETARLPWRLWIAIGCFTLLLVSPRTESPTFVLAGPSYLLLTTVFLREKKPTLRAYSLIALLVGFFLITLSFNDLWPKALWNPLSYRYATKTFGVLWLWALTAGHLSRALWLSR